MPKQNDGSISLNKFISNTGKCSRREADEMIDHQRVMLNGKLARKGNRVKDGDVVTIDGKKVKNKSAGKPKIYIALNKPEGVTCTTDQGDKDNIIDFVNHKKRIFPIGRLDKASTGLILLTNDGDIVNKILRAENRHEKEYIVTVNKAINHKFVQDMRAGVPILGTRTKKCRVDQVGPQVFRIVLTQGLNRQIRRMCEHFGYRVVALKRVRIMNIRLDRMQLGEYRNLSPKELSELQSQL